MQVLVWFNVAILIYYVALNIAYTTLIVVAFYRLRSYVQRIRSLHVDELVASSGSVPISVIAPAYNEAATIADSVRSLLTLRYSDFEVVVVNDGSTDETLERLIEEFALHPAERAATGRITTKPVRGVYRSSIHDGLYVVDKENGGKADALNTGINHSRGAVFCAMDADTMLEPDALARVVRPFLEDSTTIAVGGIVRIANGCVVDDGVVSEVRLPKRLLARFQVLEYLRAFLAARVGWDGIGATLIISGAFGVFRRSAVEAAGGYSTTTVGEDMELIVRLHRRAREGRTPYRISFVPDPVAWTEVPDTIDQLGRQRDRWQRGLAEVMRRHRSMIGRPRYGSVGVLAMPFYVVFELFSPIIELAGWVALVGAVFLGAVSWWFVVTYLALALFLGSALSVASLALEEMSFQRYRRFSDLLVLVGTGLLESFGYRQMATYWRLRGLVSFARGDTSWGDMARTGFTSSSDDELRRVMSGTS